MSTVTWTELCAQMTYEVGDDDVYQLSIDSDGDMGSARDTLESEALARILGRAVNYQYTMQEARAEFGVEVV